jgi:antibiotic biosynthesis monooxygenase (ABM) superfamily enzyme
MPVTTQLRFLGIAILGAYLVINLLMFVLGPLTQGMPQLAMTAVIVPPMVLAMVFLVIPAARRATQSAASPQAKA